MLITSLSGTSERRSRSRAHLSTPFLSVQVRSAEPLFRAFDEWIVKFKQLPVPVKNNA